jgi:GTPase Era involved in 16S rRNA processing
MLVGRDVTCVSDDINSCTQKIEPFIITRANGPRIVLVDTPGFDDTFLDDTEILRRIAIWLATS